MNIRMLPPSIAQYQTAVVNGRTYSATPGSVVDVPDFDSLQLAANGWTTVAPSGPTSARPSGSLGIYPAAAGVHFYDTTVGKLIVFDGATWRSPVDGSSV